MIGQKNNLQIKQLPHFMILAGEKGSGRHTLSKELAKKFFLRYIEVPPTVESVREVLINYITNAVYVIDYNALSTAAIQALLKTCEEPLSTTHIIILTTAQNAVVGALTSRAECIMDMEDYSKEELEEIATQSGLQVPYIEFAKTPQDLFDFATVGNSLFEFAYFVADKFYVATFANRFKIQQKAVPLHVFFRILQQVLVKTACGDTDKLRLLCTTAQASSMLPTHAEQAVFDWWILTAGGEE